MTCIVNQNRYHVAALEAERRIEDLQARIDRFKERGVRLNSIPSMEVEIEKLRAAIPTLRGTAKLCKDLYGEYA